MNGRCRTNFDTCDSLSLMSLLLTTKLVVLRKCSKLRMVDDLLFGVHLAAAAESMALGACAGLETQILYDIISNAAGSSRSD